MSNKIMFGADLIKVLEKEYKLNKLGEVPTKYKNGVTTIDFIYGKEKDIDDLKYNKPYVEFSIDDETDGFICGTMYLNGVESVQFDSWDDLKYFMKNAKWTESEKYTRKSIKENLTRYDMIGQGFFVLISDISFGLCEQLGNKTQDTHWIRSFDTEKQAINFANKKGYPIVYEKFNESKKSARKSLKEETYNDGNYTYPKVITIYNVDEILKSVKDDNLEGYRFDCEDIDIADLIYSNSFQKYFLNDGKIKWGKVKKSPFTNELLVLGELNKYYDILIALESKENPFGYSKILYFEFFKKFDWIESNKSTRKSIKESKVDFQSVIDKVIPKEYAKNKNTYKYALSCVESLYNEDEYDSDSAKVYFLNCYISDSFPSWVDELGEEEIDAFANALYDGTMKWSDIDSSWLESKKFVRKSIKEGKDSAFYDGIAKEFHFSKDEKTRYKDKTYISAIAVLFDRINNAIKTYGRNSDEEYNALNDCWEVISSAKQNGFNVDYDEDRWNKIAGLPNYH